MRIFSTFTGIGGFEVGIENAYRSKSLSTIEQNRERRNRNIDEGGGDVLPGHQSPLCIGYSEIDKYASSVYEKHYPGVPNYGDITQISAAELPDFDILVGGFPCQAFSIAGKRQGFNDTRGTLFFDLARILKQKQPRLFVFENVKGLLSHDQGRTFTTILAAIDELGYDCQWQVLNSKNFGVPQNRERIIIVGHLRGTTRPEVFPIGEDENKDTRLSGHISNTLTARYEGAQAVGTYIGESKLDAQEIKIRRLTPKECERLQAFPDDWTKEGAAACSLEKCDRCDLLNENDQHMVLTQISDTQRYKMCGNAVTTNVIQAVFERIFDNE